MGTKYELEGYTKDGRPIYGMRDTSTIPARGSVSLDKLLGRGVLDHRTSDEPPTSQPSKPSKPSGKGA